MDSIRRDLVSALSARSAPIVDAITTLVEQRLGALGGDADDEQWVRTSAQTNVELLLQVMAYPDDLARVQPPLGGVALVRRIAQRDVPFYELVRGYQLAEWYWVRQCLRELAELTGDTETLVAETVEVHDLVRGYIDRVCHGLSAEYEAERERWRHRADSARAGVVTALLRGTSVGLAEAEATLGYRLGQRHLAAIVWAAGTQPGDDPAGARQVVADLVRTMGSPGRPLVVARDDATLWVWLPLASSSTPDLTTAMADGGVRVALGEPAAGVDGFVASHRQAATAFEVGSVAGADVGSVFPYREVSGLALLCADIPRARAWVGEILGALAGPGQRAAELRHTIRTYTNTRSATTTARLLNCHKNTIQYRIRSTERLLGHPVDSGGTNLALALLACRWLGEALLGEVGAPQTLP